MRDTGCRDALVTDSYTVPYTLLNGATRSFAVPTVGMYPRFKNEERDSTGVSLIKAVGYPLSRSRQVARLARATEEEDNFDICNRFLLLASSLLEIPHPRDENVAMEVLSGVEWEQFVPFISSIVNKCEVVSFGEADHDLHENLINILNLSSDTVNQIANLAKVHLRKGFIDVMRISEHPGCFVGSLGTHVPPTDLSVHEGADSQECGCEEFVKSEPQRSSSEHTSVHTSAGDVGSPDDLQVAKSDGTVALSTDVVQGTDSPTAVLLTSTQSLFKILTPVSQAVDSLRTIQMRDELSEQPKHLADDTSTLVQRQVERLVEKNSMYRFGTEQSYEGCVNRPLPTKSALSDELYEINSTKDDSYSRVPVSPSITRSFQILPQTEQSEALSSLTNSRSSESNTSFIPSRASNREAQGASIEDMLDRILQMLGKAAYVPRVHLATARTRDQR